MGVTELASISGLSLKDLGMAGDDKKGKKRKKDPERPKRATTAYLVFCDRHRKGVMRKNPELRSKQVTTELARLWQQVEPGSAPSARMSRPRTPLVTSGRWMSTTSARRNRLRASDGPLPVERFKSLGCSTAMLLILQPCASLVDRCTLTLTSYPDFIPGSDGDDSDGDFLRSPSRRSNI